MEANNLGSATSERGDAAEVPEGATLRVVQMVR